MQCGARGGWSAEDGRRSNLNAELGGRWPAEVAEGEETNAVRGMLRGFQGLTLSGIN